MSDPKTESDPKPKPQPPGDSFDRWQNEELGIRLGPPPPEAGPKPAEEPKPEGPPPPGGATAKP